VIGFELAKMGFLAFDVDGSVHQHQDLLYTVSFRSTREEMVWMDVHRSLSRLRGTQAPGHRG
jgi:hypothetical protein